MIRIPLRKIKIFLSRLTCEMNKLRNYYFVFFAGIDISVKSQTGCTAEDILRSIPSRAAEEALNILKSKLRAELAPHQHCYIGEHYYHHHCGPGVIIISILFVLSIPGFYLLLYAYTPCLSSDYFSPVFHLT